MNKITLFIVALVTVMVSSLPAQAVSPVRSGDRNFQRGWKSLSFNNMDTALGHFRKAADAYARAMTEDADNHTLQFPSTKTKAGMSLYYAERYRECLDVMGQVPGQKKRLWEPAIYTALSHGFLGDKDAMTTWLGRYLDLLPGQPILSNEVKRQLQAMEAGSASTLDAAAAIDTAILKQARNNIVLRSRTLPFGLEKCNGAYWWRFNRAPCSRKHFMSDSD